MPLRDAQRPTSCASCAASAAASRCAWSWSLRFGYGAIVPWVTRLHDGTLRAIAGPDMVLLRTPVDAARRELHDRRRVHRRGRRDACRSC